MTVTVLRLPVVQARPRVRGDCVNGPRPCPHKWCRHWLPNPEHSCVLDEVEARKGEPVSHPEISKIFGWTRSCSWLYEKNALKKLAKRLEHLEGTRIAEAISALASVQSSIRDTRIWQKDDPNYQPCDGWAVEWPLNTERIYEIYERESNGKR